MISTIDKGTLRFTTRLAVAALLLAGGAPALAQEAPAPAGTEATAPLRINVTAYAAQTTGGLSKGEPKRIEGLYNERSTLEWSPVSRRSLPVGHTVLTTYERTAAFEKTGKVGGETVRLRVEFIQQAKTAELKNANSLIVVRVNGNVIAATSSKAPGAFSSEGSMTVAPVAGLLATSPAGAARAEGDTAGLSVGVSLDYRGAK